ncbi:MAG: hypothetical protein L6Q35_11115 [Phycisphaerales bacterium]|nr:hypothetical protein [Phycisphaerales bacterium]
MSIRASLRSLERRVALAMPAPACPCLGAVVQDPALPPEPPVCPRCGKKRLVIVIEDDYEAPPVAAGGRAS